jgi:hypothetical protein
MRAAVPLRMAPQQRPQEHGRAGGQTNWTRWQEQAPVYIAQSRIGYSTPASCVVSSCPGSACCLLAHTTPADGTEAAATREHGGGSQRGQLAKPFQLTSPLRLSLPSSPPVCLSVCLSALCCCPAALLLLLLGGVTGVTGVSETHSETAPARKAQHTPGRAREGGGGGCACEMRVRIGSRVLLRPAGTTVHLGECLPCARLASACALLAMSYRCRCPACTAPTTNHFPWHSGVGSPSSRLREPVLPGWRALCCAHLQGWTSGCHSHRGRSYSCCVLTVCCHFALCLLHQRLSVSPSFLPRSRHVHDTPHQLARTGTE